MGVSYPEKTADLVEQLVGRKPLPPLSPRGEWKRELTVKLQSVSLEDLFGGQRVKDRSFADAFRSGLLLWNDALDASHAVSQKIPHETGSYWHGIMHRREGDFGNSQYWFRRTGQHPVFGAVHAAAVQIASDAPNPSEQLTQYGSQLKTSGSWDPIGFVDWCDAAESNPRAPHDVVSFLEAVQAVEMRLLLEYSYQRAVG